MPNLGGGSAQPQTDTVHNCAVLHAHLQPEYSKYPDFGEKLQLLGPRAFNVGVDVNDFYPVSLKQIMDMK